MVSATPTPDLALDLTHVSKTYKGRIRALQGITMQVRRGEVFGLLGPNGAGKSTLVKIMMTVIRPTQAKGTMLGRPIGHKPTLARVGYLPEHHRFPEYLTGAQVLDFYGALAKVPRKDRRQRSAKLLEMVGMTAWADKRVRGYSKGMRQRIGVAQALMNDPDLVVLDEPTDGVDPVGRRDIRHICSQMRDDGRTVFINSHLLSELEMVCDRVAILVQGHVASQGTIDELTRGQQGYELQLAEERPDLLEPIFRAALPAGAGRPQAIERQGAAPIRQGTILLGTLPGGEAVILDKSTLRVRTNEAAVMQPLIDALRARGAIIRSMRPVRPSLEDLFMEAVTDPVTGAVLAPGAAAPGQKAPPNGGRP
jgi:ABC-2 type transport system ATP-binding protein